ncbi:hypothetical protein [Arthrobacter sp. B0490]|uniref:hypothetical protein n=1 Tax=Arthrobacter sp. B0490 TaxID=2058891 RepID=UPI0011B07BD2|nr:hypothetical protein [Arthrobacter sp. B0490]
MPSAYRRPRGGPAVPFVAWGNRSAHPAARSATRPAVQVVRAAVVPHSDGSHTGVPSRAAVPCRTVPG